MSSLTKPENKQQNEQQRYPDSHAAHGNLCKLEWISRAIAAAKNHSDAGLAQPEPAGPRLEEVD